MSKKHRMGESSEEPKVPTPKFDGSPEAMGLGNIDLPDPEVLEAVDARPAQSMSMSELGKRGGPKNFALTEAKYRMIIELVAAGNYQTVAAQAVGLSRDTLRRYIARGRAGWATVEQELGEDHGYDEDTVDNPLPDVLSDNDWMCCRFFAAIEKAEARGEAHAVAVVRKAMGQGHWAAAMTFLERKAPERWRRRDRLEIEPVRSADDQGLLGVEAQGHLHDALRAASAGELVEGGATGEAPEAS